MFEIKWNTVSFRHGEIELFALRRDAYMFDISLNVGTYRLTPVKLWSICFKMPFGVEAWLKAWCAYSSQGFGYKFSKPSKHYWEFNVLFSSVDKV